MALDGLFDEDDYGYSPFDVSYEDPAYIEWLKAAGTDDFTLRKEYLAKVVYPALITLLTKEEAKIIIKAMFKYFLENGTFLGFLAPAV